jgi:hypothetical protein
LLINQQSTVENETVFGSTCFLLAWQKFTHGSPKQHRSSNNIYYLKSIQLYLVLFTSQQLTVECETIFGSTCFLLAWHKFTHGSPKQRKSLNNIYYLNSIQLYLVLFTNQQLTVECETIIFESTCFLLAWHKFTHDSPKQHRSSNNIYYLNSIQLYLVLFTSQQLPVECETIFGSTCFLLAWHKFTHGSPKQRKSLRY